MTAWGFINGLMCWLCWSRRLFLDMRVHMFGYGYKEGTVFESLPWNPSVHKCVRVTTVTTFFSYVCHVLGQLSDICIQMWVSPLKPVKIFFLILHLSHNTYSVSASRDSVLPDAELWVNHIVMFNDIVLLVGFPSPVLSRKKEIRKDKFYSWRERGMRVREWERQSTCPRREEERARTHGGRVTPRRIACQDLPTQRVD